MRCSSSIARQTLLGALRQGLVREPRLRRRCIHDEVRFLALAMAASAAFVASTVVAPAAPAATCPGTRPNSVTNPDAGFSAKGFNHGNRLIRVQLNWKDGVLRAGRLPSGGAVAIVNPDGSIYAKLGWWRGVPGTFSITGRRLGRAAPALRVSLHTASYPTIGFIPSGLTFPTTGCWRVTARQGVGRLSFVVRVTTVAKG
jgi:hypothetical protein